MSMISFARVCVEVQGGARLPTSVDIKLLDGTRTIKVEYEWKPSYCPSCACFGHRCPDPPSPSPVVIPTSEVPTGQEEVPQPPANHEWQQVSGRKSKPSASRQNPISPVLDASRTHSRISPIPAASPPDPRMKAPLEANSSISESEDDSVEEEANSIEDNSDNEVPSVVPSTIPAELVEVTPQPPPSKSSKRRNKKNKVPPAPPESSSGTAETSKLRVARPTRSARNK